MLKAYAAYFTAYLLDNLKSADNIMRISLFGSASRGEAEQDSDIDIFIETKRKTNKFGREVQHLVERFYQGRESALFKAKGIKNRFSIKIGNLKEWAEIYKSIASTGIVLYGPYEATNMPTGMRHFAIIFWEGVGKNRGAFLNKLYGFRAGAQSYSGLLSKFEGKKIGKSCIMIPVQYKANFLQLIRHHEVKAKIIEAFV